MKEDLYQNNSLDLLMNMKLNISKQALMHHLLNALSEHSRIIYIEG